MKAFFVFPTRIYWVVHRTRYGLLACVSHFFSHARLLFIAAGVKGDLTCFPKITSTIFHKEDGCNCKGLNLFVVISEDPKKEKIAPMDS